MLGREVQAKGWLPRMAIEENQAISGGLCSCVGLTLSTERGIILSPVRYSHAGKGSTFRQMLWPLPLQRLQPISVLQHAGPEAAGLQELVVGWAPFRSRTLWGVGDNRTPSQPPPTPTPLTLDFVLHFPRSACLSVPLYSSVEERDDRGADGSLSPTNYSQPPGKAD